MDSNLDPDEVTKECNDLKNGSEKILEKSNIQCRNNKKILPIIIKKEEQENCFYKIQGSC